RTGAGDAPDGPVAGLVQRVVRNLVDLDVGPDAPLVPVGQRMELPDVVAVRPLEFRGAGPARRLVAADPRNPAVVRLERLEQRLDLAYMATTVGVELPEVRALALWLLGDRQHPWPPEFDPVPL